MSREYLLSIGVMTGNSLDGVDTVLTRFGRDGSMVDLASSSLSSPAELTTALRSLRTCVNDAKGDVHAAMAAFDRTGVTIPDAIPGNYELPAGLTPFERVHAAYLRWIAEAVTQLIEHAKRDPRLTSYALDEIDLVGLHGQTCAHFPPSIAKAGAAAGADVYTIQLGNGRELADLLGITVVYDFRSDDVMNGGEGAPLAPVHHRHLAADTQRRGLFPIAFCNGGNTGNISVISNDTATNELVIRGFDTGPFNHFPDALMRSERNESCDRDGIEGKKGVVNLDLLKLLFDRSVVTSEGENFLLKPPPRSSDPQWYRMLPELTGDAAVNGSSVSFQDRLRTAAYFSAYTFFFSLSHIPESIEMPRVFAVCGGGWRNPLVMDHFKALISGDTTKSPLLPEHRELFRKIVERLRASGVPIACDSSEVGFDGTAMEARIFADSAVCRITGEPFSLPSTTGVAKPCVLGIVRYPGGDAARGTSTLAAWAAHYGTAPLADPQHAAAHPAWCRASAGWRTR